MKTKTKNAILASVVLLAMMAMTAPVLAQPSEDREMPAENDPFWAYFAQMSRPDDTTTCLAFAAQLGQSYMSEFCNDIADMPTEMEREMTSEGINSNIFTAPDWHNVNNLYFEKAGVGKIQFTKTIDFMNYRFFNFMSNFNDLVNFDDGYISLNASMVTDMINYGAILTMYGLDFPEMPDIYVTAENGSIMQKASASDIGDISYNAATGELSFVPKHFSAFQAIAKGAKVKTMKISSVRKRTIKYNAKKNTFKLTVKGRHLYKKGSDASCTLGFRQAERVWTAKNGKKLICRFRMENFNVAGFYPLTISIPGQGEVTKTNAVRIR